MTQGRGREEGKEGGREQANGQGEERRKTERGRGRDEQARTPHCKRQCARERDGERSGAAEESEVGRGRSTEIVRGGERAREILNVRDTEAAGQPESG